MTNDERDDAIDSQALTGGDITKYRALVARISSHLSQDRPDLKFTSMHMERVERIGRCLVGKPRAECLFHWQQRGELEAYSESTRRSVSAGLIKRWTAESDLYASF